MNRQFHLLAAAAVLAFCAAVPARSQATAPDNDSRQSATAASEGAAQNPSDVVLQQTVQRALLQDRNLGNRAQDVTIVAQDGHVTLRGLVDTPQQKQKASERAAAVAGADNVTDEIQLVPLKPHGPYRSGRFL